MPRKKKTLPTSAQYPFEELLRLAEIGRLVLEKLPGLVDMLLPPARKRKRKDPTDGGGMPETLP